MRRLISGLDCDVVDLSKQRIHAFRYDQAYPIEDDFLPIVERMIAAPVVILATPVYWYSFSTSMKNFLDRISDLLMSRKDVGRQLRGTKWALLSSGSDDSPDPDLISAFRRTCDYLGISSIAEVYAVESGPFTDESAAERVRAMMPAKTESRPRAF